MNGQQNQGTISNVEATLPPNDLRFRKPSGPGSYNRESSNRFSPTEIHPSTRLIHVAAQAANRRRVTAATKGPSFTRLIYEGRAESLESRFTARTSLYRAE